MQRRRGSGQSAKWRRTTGPKARKTPTTADLQQQIEALTRELKEQRDQRKAASDLLNVISHSGFDLHTVLDTLVESATRLCNADYAWVFERNDDVFRWLASFGHATDLHACIKKYYETHVVSVDRGSAVGRAALEGRVIHISDVLSDPEYTYGEAQKIGGYRSVLGVPLLGKGGVIGAIFVAKVVPQPFTDKQIELVTNFAAQAVIAIENTRLLSELRESLEQQTATSEVLRVISSSPGDLTPVFNAMLENATKLCGAEFGLFYLDDEDLTRIAASYNVPPALAATQNVPYRVHPKSGHAETRRTKQVVHIDDIRVMPPYLEGDPRLVAIADLGGARTTVGVPMLRGDTLLGVLAIYRKEVRPFTAKQIELVSNFAKQAVIAIENARLLNELRQSLEQQTATSEVLGVISSSPGELELVFDAMLANATRVCEASYGALWVCEGDGFRNVALHGALPADYAAELRRMASFRPHSETPMARVARTKVTVHTADISAEKSYMDRDPLAVGKLAMLKFTLGLNEHKTSFDDAFHTLLQSVAKPRC